MSDITAEFVLEEQKPIDAIFHIGVQTSSHADLEDRELENQHPINAITGLNTELESLNDKINIEKVRAETEESRLDGKIDNEIVARTQDTADLSQELSSEVQRAINQENELSEKIDRINNDLTQDIDTLSTIVENNYTQLNTKITEVAGDLEQIIEDNVIALQQEDTSLQNQINTHSTTLTAYDTRITNNSNAISQEIINRQNADDILTGEIENIAGELDYKQDIISDLQEIRTNAQTGSSLAPQVEVNTQRIEELIVNKLPNAVIIGTPHIEGGQVSGFSASNYMQFPFIDISRGLPFDIYFSFTTTQDITTQQNVLDAYFGIALAIQNGKGVMALSSNGSSWDIGMSTGTNILQPNTTYFVKYSWTGSVYSASLSTDDTTYVPDMNLASTLSPHKTTIFIGGSPNIFGVGSSHPFKGTINFNKSKVVVNGITVWEGMADVGLQSRANVSLNNLDEVGEARFSNLATKSELPTLARANVPGLVAGGNWLTVDQTTGKMECGELTKTQYDVALGYTFISKTTLENVLNGRTIITKSNNQSGNIKYSDGRMEQWGLATTSNTGETEFTMSGGFMDTNFQVFIEPRQSGDLVHYAIPSAVNKFKARIQNTSGTYMACQFQWRAWGFWK